MIRWNRDPEQMKQHDLYPSEKDHLDQTVLSNIRAFLLGLIPEMKFSPASSSIGDFCAVRK
jgi:hypothetical protein